MPGILRNAVLGAVAATAIAGCGSDDGTIPPNDAENLINRLDVIESHVQDQNCDQAQAQADGFRDEVNLLPASVDDEVKRGLQQVADQLVELAESDCEVDEGTTDIGGAVDPETTEATDTTDATTETETTDTTDEQTTEEPEEPVEEPVEPDTAQPQESEQIEPPTGNQGQGGGSVGSDGGVGPSGGVGSGGEG